MKVALIEPSDVIAVVCKQTASSCEPHHPLTVFVDTLNNVSLIGKTDFVELHLHDLRGM